MLFKFKFPIASQLNFSSSIDQNSLSLFWVYISVNVGEEQAEVGDGVRHIISLESLCYHKRSNVELELESWIPLTLIWCQINTEL